MVQPPKTLDNKLACSVFHWVVEFLHNVIIEHPECFKAKNLLPVLAAEAGFRHVHYSHNVGCGHQHEH